MTTKLTLTIDKDLVESAKNHVRGSGRTLSDRVSVFLENIIASPETPAGFSEIVSELHGAFAEATQNPTQKRRGRKPRSQQES